MRRELRRQFEEWDRKAEEMRKNAGAIDWSKIDMSALDPKDISVEYGPMMTREQFLAWKQNRHVKIMKR